MGGEQRPSWAVRIESERVARGWGKFTLARHLFSAVGIDRHDPSKVKNLAKQITRHERGEVFPTAWADAYALAFGIERGELFRPVDVRAGTVDRTTTPAQGDDVKRRAALQLLAVIGTEATVPPGVLEAVLADFDQAGRATTDVEEWERVVRDYGQRIYQQPLDLPTLLAGLVADMAAVGDLLKKGHRPCDQAGLLRVGAGLSGVLAEVLSNAGDDRAARRTWSTARRMADASGDRQLQVWTRGRAAQHACWADGSRQTVMALVDEAVQITDGAPSSGLVRAHAAGAYMAALQGDRRTAYSSLDNALRAFERVRRSSGELSLLEFQESQLTWNKAYIWTVFGHRGAAHAIDNARTLYPSDALGPLTNLSLMRAFGLVRDGEPREGLDLAITTLEARPRPVMATRQLAGQILNALPDSARALPSARELHALLSPKRTAPTDFSR